MIISQGDIYHHESLVKAIKQVDVVICALGSPEQMADQVKIIAAIKEAGNIKARHISSKKLFNIFPDFFFLFFGEVVYLVLTTFDVCIKKSFYFKMISSIPLFLKVFQKDIYYHKMIIWKLLRWKMEFMPCHRVHILKLTSTSLILFIMSEIYFYQMMVMTFLEVC